MGVKLSRQKLSDGSGVMGGSGLDGRIALASATQSGHSAVGLSETAERITDIRRWRCRSAEAESTGGDRLEE